MSFKFSIKPFFKVPKRLVKQPKLTVAQIFAKIRTETKAKARRVQVMSIETMRTPKTLVGYTTYRVVTLNLENGHRYKLTIFSPTEKITKDTKLIIDDPCGVFVFKYEYALAKRGNAFIYRTNGEPPVQTNPRLRPGLSHHGMKAILELIKYTKSFRAPKVRR